MGQLDYRVTVDWIGGSLLDITDDVLSCVIGYGKSEPRFYYPITPGGVCVLTLNNERAIYNPSDPGAGLPREIIPGSIVSVYSDDGTEVLEWRGRLWSLTPSAQPDVVKISTLEAVGPLTWISQRKFNNWYNDFDLTLSGTMINNTLDLIDFPSSEREVDPGRSKVNAGALVYAGALGDVRNSIAIPNILRTIAITEFGSVRESHDNKIVFEDRHNRVRNYEVKGGFSDIASELGGSVNRAIMDFINISQAGSHTDSVINRFEAEITSLETTDEEEIVNLAPLRISAGQTVSVSWVIPEDSVFSFVQPFFAPSVFQDITEQNGLEFSIQVTNFEHTPTSFKFDISASKNVNITRLSVKGQKVFDVNFQGVFAQDSDSISRYDLKTQEFPSQVVVNLEEAENYVKAALSVFKDPLPALELTYAAEASDNTRYWALRHRLSNVVSVKSDYLGVDSNYFIEHIRKRIQPGGLHFVTYLLSDARAVEPWMRFQCK